MQAMLTIADRIAASMASSPANPLRRLPELKRVTMAKVISLSQGDADPVIYINVYGELWKVILSSNPPFHSPHIHRVDWNFYTDYITVHLFPVPSLVSSPSFPQYWWQKDSQVNLLHAYQIVDGKNILQKLESGWDFEARLPTVWSAVRNLSLW